MRDYGERGEVNGKRRWVTGIGAEEWEVWQGPLEEERSVSYR